LESAQRADAWNFRGSAHGLLFGVYRRDYYLLDYQILYGKCCALSSFKDRCSGAFLQVFFCSTLLPKSAIPSGMLFDLSLILC
jgi:hypothetical protein